MRLKRVSACQPVTRRTGVSASVMTTSRSVQMPVSLVTSTSGSAVRSLFIGAPDEVREWKQRRRKHDGLENPADAAVGRHAQ